MLNKGVVSLAYTKIENLSSVASKSLSLGMCKVTTFGRNTELLKYLYGLVMILYIGVRNRKSKKSVQNIRILRIVDLYCIPIKGYIKTKT